MASQRKAMAVEMLECNWKNVYRTVREIRKQAFATTSRRFPGRSGRNPLLEQMRPMPPATYTKGHSIVAREATFDPLRGAFIILARPDEPEPTVPERRVGRATGRAKIPDNLTAAMVRGGC